MPISVENINNLNCDTLTVKKGEGLSYAMIRSLSENGDNLSKKEVEKAYQELAKEAKQALSDLIKTIEGSDALKKRSVRGKYNSKVVYASESIKVNPEDCDPEETPAPEQTEEETNPLHATLKNENKEGSNTSATVLDKTDTQSKPPEAERLKPETVLSIINDCDNIIKKQRQQIKDMPSTTDDTVRKQMGDTLILAVQNKKAWEAVYKSQQNNGTDRDALIQKALDATRKYVVANKKMNEMLKNPPNTAPANSAEKLANQQNTAETQKVQEAYRQAQEKLKYWTKIVAGWEAYVNSTSFTGTADEKTMLQTKITEMKKGKKAWQNIHDHISTHQTISESLMKTANTDVPKAVKASQEAKQKQMEIQNRSTNTNKSTVTPGNVNMQGNTATNNLASTLGTPAAADKAAEDAKKKAEADKKAAADNNTNVNANQTTTPLVPNESSTDGDDNLSFGEL